MDSKNIILNLPFDEQDGATTTFDYSRNRADGTVVGAHFVPGRNGNAIKFSGEDYCELKKEVFNLSMDFSILAWVRADEVECGSPTKLIWLLNFEGFNNYTTIEIEAKPGTWFSLAVTRCGSEYNFYVNSALYKTVNNAGTLEGISLNQDYYGGVYGFCMLDDVKCYNVELKQSELIQEISAAKQQAYTIDGVDFREYGVFVSDSKGILNRPKMKKVASVNFDNYHGESVDLQHKFCEKREITLSCFIKAANKDEFINRVTAFEQLFDKKGTNRLVIDVHPIKPLIYEVYCESEIDISKKWNNNLMVGTFNLKLIEPEPVKRILKHIRVDESTKACSVKMSSTKYVNIYWGDGLVDYDLVGDIQIVHDYATNGDYFPVITGDIDLITNFETNAIVVWNKL